MWVNEFPTLKDGVQSPRRCEYFLKKNQEPQRPLSLKVRCVEWSLDDGRLVSCGMDGAVYEWNTQTGKRESESVLKSCGYTGVAFSSDCKTALAVGTDLTLKEIQDCQVGGGNAPESPPDQAEGPRLRERWSRDPDIYTV